MKMTLEGAALIAQVIPVLLLVLGVEARALGPIRRPPAARKAARGWWWTRYALTLAGVAVMVGAEMTSVLAVAEGRAPSGLWSTWIALGFVSGLWLCIAPLVGLVGGSFDVRQAESK